MKQGHALLTASQEQRLDLEIDGARVSTMLAASGAHNATNALLAAAVRAAEPPPIKVGEFASLTGKEATFGQSSHKGTLLAIEEINTVRKHLSSIQGGRLAAACAARIYALVISDVTGDDPTHIASGPCAPDPTTYADALAILARYGCAVPPAVMDTLQRGARGELGETPKPGDTVFARAENRVSA